MLNGKIKQLLAVIEEEVPHLLTEQEKKDLIDLDKLFFNSFWLFVGGTLAGIFFLVFTIAMLFRGEVWWVSLLSFGLMGMFFYSIIGSAKEVREYSQKLDKIIDVINDRLTDYLRKR